MPAHQQPPSEGETPPTTPITQQEEQKEKEGETVTVESLLIKIKELQKQAKKQETLQKKLEDRFKDKNKQVKEYLKFVSSILSPSIILASKFDQLIQKDEKGN